MRNLIQQDTGMGQVLAGNDKNWEIDFETDSMKIFKYVPSH